MRACDSASVGRAATVGATLAVVAGNLRRAARLVLPIAPIAPIARGACLGGDTRVHRGGGDLVQQAVRATGNRPRMSSESDTSRHRGCGPWVVQGNTSGDTLVDARAAPNACRGRTGQELSAGRFDGVVDEGQAMFAGIKTSAGLRAGCSTRPGRVRQPAAKCLARYHLLAVVMLMHAAVMHAEAQVLSAPSLWQPSNFSTIETATPTLRWFSSAGASWYRVQVLESPYLDFNVIYTSAAISTTSLALPAGLLADGRTYQWRVRAETAFAASGYTAFPSRFTVSVPTPAKIQLWSPSSRSVVTTNQPRIAWFTDFDADRYQVQIYAPPYGSVDLIHDVETALSSYTVPTRILAHGVEYAWGVRGRSDSGGLGPWSDAWFFTVDDPTPATPILMSPLDGATTTTTEPTFTWLPALRADGYILIVWPSDSFDTVYSSVAGHGLIVGTSHQMPPGILHVGATYRWYIGGWNDSGVGDASDRWSFTVGDPPPVAPILVSPLAGATVTTTEPTFTWLPALRADGYSLIVWPSDSFDTVYASAGSHGLILATSFQIPSGILQSGATYRWQVRGWNESELGEPSAFWSFTVNDPTPVAPVPVSPLAGATVTTTEPTFTWLAALKADSYLLMIFPPDSLVPVYSSTEYILGTSLQIPSGILQVGGEYRWVVWGTNGSGNGDGLPLVSVPTIARALRLSARTRLI
jgi:hypothetical protein